MKSKRNLILFSMGLAIIFAAQLFIFRALIPHMTTRLLDWNDYPYVVWVIFQVIDNIFALQIPGFFDSNAFYPHEGSLLFSDLLLPQALITAVFFLLTSNHLLSFNLMFFTTLLLNSFGALKLSQTIWKTPMIFLPAGLVLSISPFLFFQLGHVQMISFWPTLLALSMLLKNPSALSVKRSVMISLLWVIQFYASVYLSVFFAAMFAWWFFVHAAPLRNEPKHLKHIVKHTLIIGAVFSALVVPVVIQYKMVQHKNEAAFNYGEYAQYAAHFTDYLFTPYGLPSTTIFAKWNSLNLHVSGEPVRNPSFLLSVLALIGIVQLSVYQKTFSLSFSLTTQRVFFLGLLVFGFIASLGPRLSANGFYTGIPLPYDVALKVIPLLEPVRATSRWYFLVFLGVWFFAFSVLARVKRHRFSTITVAVAVGLYLLEVVPHSYNTTPAQFSSEGYTALAALCQQENKQVLLEFPLSVQFAPDEKIDIIKYLQYKSGISFSSLSHDCLMVNGYSGFTPSSLTEYEAKLMAATQLEDSNVFFSLLSERDVSVLKINKSADITSTHIVEAWLERASQVEIISNSHSVLVAKIHRE